MHHDCEGSTVSLVSYVKTAADDAKGCNRRCDSFKKEKMSSHI